MDIRVFANRAVFILIIISLALFAYFDYQRSKHFNSTIEALHSLSPTDITSINVYFNESLGGEPKKLTSKVDIANFLSGLKESKKKFGSHARHNYHSSLIIKPQQIYIRMSVPSNIPDHVYFYVGDFSANGGFTSYGSLYSSGLYPWFKEHVIGNGT